MSHLQRVKKVLNWLIYIGYASNNMEIALKMGYTKSSFSQIINGKVPLSDKFIEKLSSINSNINKLWITDEEGEMFIKEVDQVNAIKEAEYLNTGEKKILNDFERLKKVIFWLINSGQATSQEDVAHKLGNSEYFLSQIVKGRKPLSIKFITKLCTEFNKLNPDYLLVEDVPMLLSEIPQNKSIERKEYEIKSEAIIIEDSGKCETCKKRNNRIEFLEDLLRDRDTEIARLNQEIGQLKLNQIEPKKGKAHYG